MESFKKNRQLEAEVETLRIRLEEAEETLRAIRNNEVDALVIDGPGGAQQIFTLQGAEQPYRILMETMSEGALSMTADGAILYCNSRFSELIRMPLNQVISTPFHDFVLSRDGNSLEAMLRDCGREGCRGEFLLKTADGEEVPVSLSARSLTLSNVEAFCVVATDLTTQKRTQEMLEKARDQLEETVALRTAALQREIEERRLAEEAVREAGERLMFAQEAAGAGMWDWDMVSGKLNWSPRLFHLFGLDPTTTEATFDIWHDIVHPGDRQTSDQRIQLAIKNRSSLDSEYRIILPSGETRWITALGNMTYDAQGRALRMSGICLDGTERKQMEEALKESEERFRAAFDGSAVPTSITAPDGKMIKVNEAFCRMMGYTEAELLPLTFYEFTHPDDLRANRTGVQEMIEGKRSSVRMEKRYIRKDGRVIWGDMSSTVVRDADGLPLYMVTHVQDITERKQVDEALRQSERLYRAIGESIDYGVWVCTPDGRNVYASESFLKMVGITQEQCSDFGWGDVLHPDDAERTIAAWQDCARTGGTWNIEHRFRGVDGQWHHVLARGIPVRDEHGHITSWAGINLDIDSLKKMEEALRVQQRKLEQRVQERTAELQQAYDRLREETDERERIQDQLRQAQKIEALGTFTGGVAHDFNNILAAIIGFAELARDKLQEGSKEKSHLNRVFEAGLRGRELINQMLTFSRKTPHEKKPLHLSSVINETMRILRPSIPTTIEIKMTIKSESGMILADPVQIQQVILNLATNAAYAMRPKGGVLGVELIDFSVSSMTPDPHGMKPGCYMRLRVTDTGEGMTEDVLARIYDPFFTTKGQGEGTGLGLSVVHGIIKESDGYIMAESRPGEGTTFSLYFPQIPKRARNEDVTVEAIPTGHERILFIDDEEALVEIGRGLLTDLGYHVESKTSSREALALVRLDPRRFDLIITDQTMPDMTGVELAKEIFAIRPDIPVILCTGFSHTANEKSARASGIKGFAMKPLTKGEIARAIRNALDE